jgi:hypothetical protein
MFQRPRLAQNAVSRISTDALPTNAAKNGGVGQQHFGGVRVSGTSDKARSP